MGWFTKKPELKVGDTVWDCYFQSINKAPEKATIVGIEREGVFAQEKYFIRTAFGYESTSPRKRSELELIESAPEKPKAIDLRNQEPDTFLVFARKEYRTGFGNIPKDATARASMKNSDGYVVYYNGVQCHMSSSDFLDGFENAGQREMRMRIETEYLRRKTKEEKGMGDGKLLPWDNDAGALHGYPPEDDIVIPQDTLQALREKDEALRQKRERVAELESKVAELEKKNEVARREKVAEEYGIITERHLWSVTVSMPTKLVGFKIRHGGERKSEVLTEGRNMVEAAMAAEAMAKGIDEDANVLSIDYVRVIGVIKK